MSEKAEYYLQKGTVKTASNSAACGIDLQVGKIYVISGNSQHIGICNYVKEYSKLTSVEKKGLAAGYKHGCHCRVSFFFKFKFFL